MVKYIKQNDGLPSLQKWVLWFCMN